MSITWRPGNRLIAFVWGLAEATLFFIVPDVFLSFLALQSYKNALHASLYVLLGALCGGALMWAAASANPQAVFSLLDFVPGISPALIEMSHTLFKTGLLEGMIEGSFSGVPYKLFAAQAGAESVALGWFFIASVPARLLRFGVVCFATSSICHFFLKEKNLHFQRQTLIAAWMTFYGFYFLFLI